MASLAFDGFIVALIFANVVAFAAQTVPSVDARHGFALEVFNVVSVAIFTLEYVARLWVAVDLPPYRHMEKWRARLHFAATPLLIIDLLAILPFYLGAFLPIDLRVLRVLRLLRFLKITRYSPALQMLLRVIQTEARALIGAAIIMLALILLSASTLYFLEGRVQPEKFGSVPAAMWWSVVSLTTVGFGDSVPVTPAGKVAAGIFMVIGFAMFALPVGIISAGFSRAMSRREFTITWHMIARVPLLRRLDPHEQAHIMDLLQSHRYPAGSFIMKPGDPAQSMYFIAAGEVRVERRGREPLILKAGDHFGEMALLDKRRREAAVVARSHCHLLQLDAQDFEHLMTTRPAIAQHINEIAGMRREEGWTAGDPADPESGEPDVPHLKPEPADTLPPGVDAPGDASLDLASAREKP